MSCKTQDFDFQHYKPIHHWILNIGLMRVLEQPLVLAKKRLPSSVKRVSMHRIARVA
jgi:hypothetical protein